MVNLLVLLTEMCGLARGLGVINVDARHGGVVSMREACIETWEVERGSQERTLEGELVKVH